MSLGPWFRRVARSPAVIVSTAAISLRLFEENRRFRRGEIDRDELRTRSAGHVGGVVGSAMGAAWGGAIGSVVPGVGTIIGGFAGGVLGERGGRRVAREVAETVQLRARRRA